MIATLPSIAVEILNIGNRKRSIDERKLVLSAESSTHRSTPSKVIGAIELRCNGKRTRSFTRMNIKNGISVVQRWRSDSRRHDNEEENRESMAKI
jgi:hypothetical protein